MARILSTNIIRAEQPGNDFVAPLAMDDFHAIAGDMEVHSLFSGQAGVEAVMSDEAKREAELEDIKRESYEAGFASGEQAGMERGMREVEPVVDRFMTSIDEFRLVKNKIYNESEGEVIDLILAAAKKIIQTKVAIDRESVAGVIKNALKGLADRKEILIRINPKDYFHILEHRKRLFGDDINFKDVKFEEDDSIGMGGCLIESRHGEVDARIEKQLELLEKAMKDA